jgi:hypothetical protein
LTALGPRIAFGAAAAVMMLAALPIVWTPNVAVPQETSGTLRTAMPGILLFAADAFIAGSYVFVWQIALFLSLGESFSAFGGAMALAAFAGAVGGLLLGRLVDAGHGTRVAIVALVTMVASTMLQAVSVGNAPLAVLANASGALVACLYVPALTLHAALPHRHRSRLGPRRRQCLAGCGRAVACRRADRNLPPAVAPRHPGVILSVADLFFDARACGLNAATRIVAMRLVAAIGSYFHGCH